MKVFIDGTTALCGFYQKTTKNETKETNQHPTKAVATHPTHQRSNYNRDPCRRRQVWDGM